MFYKCLLLLQTFNSNCFSRLSFQNLFEMFSSKYFENIPSQTLFMPIRRCTISRFALNQFVSLSLNVLVLVES